MAAGLTGPAEGGGAEEASVADAARIDRAEAHALAVLEFPRALELVAGHATSEAGRRRIRRLHPAGSIGAAAARLARTDEMVGFVRRNSGWSPPPIPEAEGALRRLAAQGSVLAPSELIEVALLLASSRRARAAIRGDESAGSGLESLAARFVARPRLEERLSAAFDSAGEVADGASPELKRLRRNLRDGRLALVARLEAFARGLPSRVQVPDASVTLRSGRYCIPVRREGLPDIGGIVHDESSTHRTVFVEPPIAIESMNRLRELELAEKREVLRILTELTEAARPLTSELAGALAALGELDARYAAGRYALAHGGAPPEIGSGGRYRAVAARHPLLEAGGEPAVPFDLELDVDETVLLISGPNAGGKTVLLKTIGLLSALAQSGIVPPAGPGTGLPFFRRFFAVIGDEQSIDASLSTFGAQVSNLRTILEEVDRESLVLVDEIGASTDPAEGAALAAAVLVELAGRTRLTVATTHLGTLKTLAAENAAIVNASLQFDAAALRPTFRLRRDRPGRSYALEIARRLGLPERVLAAAHGRLDEGASDLESLLGELEQRESELARLTAEARRARRELEGREAELGRREEALGRLERKVEREALERRERYLLEARQEVERAVAELRASWPAGGEADAAAPAIGSDVGPAAGARPQAPPGSGSAHDARAAVERMVRETRERLPREQRPAGAPPRVREGVPVDVPSLGVSGRIVELREDEAVIEAGGVRLTVPADRLRTSGQEEPGEETRGAGGDAGEAAGDGEDAEVAARPDGAVLDLPDLVPRPEVDLRGLRVDEVEGVLLPALDAAIYGDLPLLRVVHGKGTGALRQRVREILREDARVTEFRTGAFDEGGSGVTVVGLGGIRE